MKPMKMPVSPMMVGMPGGMMDVPMPPMGKKVMMGKVKKAAKPKTSKKGKG